MTRQVRLTIKGIQKYPEELPLETVTKTEAEYFFRGNGHYILFEETQEGFTQSIKSMLKIKENSVELTKKGLLQSRMVFERGLTYAVDYRTPFGSLPMELETKELYVNRTKELITVAIKYALKSREQMLADCSIQITIREKQ